MMQIKAFLVKNICLWAIFFTFLNWIVAQEPNNTQLRDNETYGTATINGTVVRILVIDGDTLPVVDFDPIEVSQKRSFSSPMAQARRQSLSLCRRSYSYT